MEVLQVNFKNEILNLSSFSKLCIHQETWGQSIIMWNSFLTGSWNLYPTIQQPLFQQKRIKYHKFSTEQIQFETEMSDTAHHQAYLKGCNLSSELVYNLQETPNFCFSLLRPVAKSLSTLTILTTLFTYLTDCKITEDKNSAWISCLYYTYGSHKQ